jgi:L-alanine-DL-glutamate epimerase-like enolase superfamily enzyme
MRIERVDAIPIRIAKLAPFKSSLGVHGDSPCGIVVVDTDTGHRGVGEISMALNGGGALLCTTAHELLGPAIVGVACLISTNAPVSLRPFIV